MENLHHRTKPTAQAYAALRYGGASPERARVELAIAGGRAATFEARLHVAAPGVTTDAPRPECGGDRAHVAAVRRAGGYPVMTR